MNTNIYTNVIGRSKATFQIFIGQRGVGKTYSALEYYGVDRPLKNNYDPNKKFMFMRRTEAEIKKVIGDPKTGRSPFKNINKNRNTTVTCEYNKSDGFGYIWNNKDGEHMIGYIAALSTFAGIRGADFSDVDTIVIDEVIPEEHITQRVSLGNAYLHMLETVNRNREFEGEKAVTVMMFANSIKIANDIFAAMNIVGDIAKMVCNNKDVFYDKQKDIYIEIIVNKAFTEAKKKTKLYKMAHDTEFEKQALLNQFTDDDLRPIKKVKLNEYRLLFSFGDFVFYEHKSTGFLYITKGAVKGGEHFNLLDREMIYWRFAPSYRLAKYGKMVYYDDYATKVAIDALLSKRV